VRLLAAVTGGAGPVAPQGNKHAEAKLEERFLTIRKQRRKTMTKFAVHGAETAPEKSRPALRLAERRLGFLPNMLGVLAESPATLEAYQTLQQILGRSGFTPAEQQFLALAVSVANACTYCTAAYSLVAGNAGVPREVVEAVRVGGPIADKRFKALREFAFAVVERRGRVGQPEVEAFLAAGFTKAQVLEVLIAAAFKLISNYANHIADVPLDTAFQPYYWKARHAA
jgi:uncharacterized peroxidase-related enzyme